MPRPIVGVSLKMYMGLAQTKAWMDALASETLPDGVDLFVIPGFLSLRDAGDSLRDTRVMLGAQDVFWEEAGAYTGEISPGMLREAGCSVVEIGHAERRRLFGEDDSVVRRKTAAAMRAGLAPVLCIGETERMAPDAAVRECLRQFHDATESCDPSAPMIVAWEPVWAIGAAEPAAPDFIRAVAGGLRAALADRADTRVIYGGSAGPGLLKQLDGTVDGLFLGRFAHDIGNLRRVLAEAADCLSSFPSAGQTES